MATSWAITPPSGVENTFNITASTDIRDVSDMLDAVYLADTPLVNRLSWGSPTGNKVIEWITDNIGYGYVILSNGGTVASDASSFVVGTSGVGAQSLALKQLHTGTVLKKSNAADQTQGWAVVEAIGASGSITFDWLSGTDVSGAMTDAITLFIVGSPVNEGSTPRADTTRPRTIATNRTQIFRQDVQMTGTRMASDMYAVGNELRHQVELRIKEYRREVERSCILGYASAGSSTETQLMGGLYDFLRTQSGAHISSATSLTESALNTVAAEVYEKGGTPNVLLLGSTQARNIPTWERARVRVEQDSRVAGFYVTKYLTDLGVTLDILISRWVPKEFAFVLSIEQIKLRAMQGRKLILEKLGKVGDYTQYQLISEISLEMKGYNLGQHGMFTALT